MKNSTYNSIKQVAFGFLSMAFTAISIPVAAQSPNLKTENVIVVFKTHFDIGYTDLAGSVIKKYQTSMIEGALLEIERSKQLPDNEHFTWTLPAWTMQQILEGSSPEIKKRKVMG